MVVSGCLTTSAACNEVSFAIERKCHVVPPRDACMYLGNCSRLGTTSSLGYVIVLVCLHNFYLVVDWCMYLVIVGIDVMEKRETQEANRQCS